MWHDFSKSPTCSGECERMIKTILNESFEELTNAEVLKRLDYVSLLDSYIIYFKTGEIVLGDWRKWVNK